MTEERFAPHAGIAIGAILFCIAMVAIIVGAMSTGGLSVQSSDDKAKTYAATIMQQGVQLTNAMQRVQTNGCSADEISFENPVIGGYENPLTTDDSCYLFKQQGGDISWQQLTEEMLDPTQSAQSNFGQWYFPADTCVPNVGTGGLLGCAASNVDFIAILPYVRKSVCEQLNKIIRNTLAIPQAAAIMYDTDKFQGEYNPEVVMTYPGGDTSPRLMGCLEGNESGVGQPAGSYHFFQVLYAR